MNIKRFIYVIITLNSYCFYSQYEVDLNINNSNFTLANPDVSNFEKFILNPVNYFVGKPLVSIPIVEIKTGNIYYPLNLSYDAAGIKVDQIASNVGLGWNLNSTILTRTINQDNDFDNTGSLTKQPDVSTYNSEDITADFHAQRGSSGKIGYFLQKHTNSKMNDRQKSIDYIPDVYHFYTNNFSTSFFFNDENTPIEINPQGTTIEAIKTKNRFDKETSILGTREYNLLTQDFFTIIIITKDKLKYTFSDCDISFNQDLIVNNRVPSGHSSDPPAQVSAWHITKIEDLKTQKKIDFVYSYINSNPNSSFNNYLDMSLAQRNFEFVSEPIYTDFLSLDCFYPTMGVIRPGGYYLNINARIDHTTKYLRRIIYEEGEISFKYSGDGDPENNESGGARHDVFSGEFLSDIILKNKNFDLIKSFKLKYNYFESDYNVGEFNPDIFNNPFRYKRLKLISFQENNKPKYEFTYYENKKLPPINSFSVDFLGYSNNSIDVSNISIFAEIKPKPTLYYYPNRLEKSLLPFQLTNINGTVIPGYFDRRASHDIDVIQAWSLSKIKFPTGGNSEFIYESNMFEESGENIKGGGIRIKQQKICDVLGSIRTLNYSYLKQDSSLSSGTLFNMPFFGHPTQILFPVDLSWSNPVTITTPTPTVISYLNSFRFFGKSNLNVDINSGSYIGYSRVVESEVGKGRKEMLFSSNNISGYENVLNRVYPPYTPYIEGSGGWCFSDFIVANSGLGNNIFTDNSYKRGKLLNELFYDETNKLLFKKTIGYSDNVLNTHSFYQSFTRMVSTTNIENNFIHLFSSKKDFKIAQYLTKNQIISTYDSSGNHVDEITNYTYNSSGFIKTIENVSSNGDSNKIEYNYPTEVTTSLNSLPGVAMNYSDNFFYRNFALNGINNRKGEIIQTNFYKNNILNNYSRKMFDIYNAGTNFNNFISPKGIVTGKQNEPLQTIINIDKYDIDFNPIQYTTQNGTIVSVILGYNKTKPIAQIENLEYSNILETTITNLQTLSNADYDNCRTATCKEQLLRNALNALRTTIATSYPNARVTTYTHDPLVGVTSVTDPKTDVQYYNYDTFQRLIKVEDKNGKILSENEYNYKPQN